MELEIINKTYYLVFKWYLGLAHAAEEPQLGEV